MILTEWEAVSRAFVSLALGIVVRSLILAALCGGIAWLFRARTAELRFWLWKWLLLTLLALPLLIEMTPPLRKTSRGIARVESAILTNRAQLPATFRTYTAEPSRRQPIRFSSFILLVPGLYFFITVALLVRLRHSLIRLERIAARSEFVQDPHFREIAHGIWLESGSFLKPRIAVTNVISAPVTFECGDMWILLPNSWGEWGEPKLRAVLTHEMAHVRRRDSANLLLATLTTCLFWFHPLSWFLRRKLCALAEEACDEVAVTSVGTPEQYAGFLIDFARDVQQRGRLTLEAMAVVRSPQIARRIERLFIEARYRRRGRKGLAALAFALFAPAIYLTAAARFEIPQRLDSSQLIPWPHSATGSLSSDQVAQLQLALKANPEDFDSRMELLVYFGYSGQEQSFTEELLWFIEHRPDVQTLGMAESLCNRHAGISETSREKIAGAWEQALIEYAYSPRVVLNAATFLAETNPERALDVLQQAKPQDEDFALQFDREIAAIYAAAERKELGFTGTLNNIGMHSETGQKLSAQLEGSGNAALLAETGRILVDLTIPNDNGKQEQRGLELIKQAIRLEPDNVKWTEALESAQAEPQRRLNYQRLLKPQAPEPGTVRISASVAEANLIGKVEPVYPPLALAARIQGVVEFTVTVGPDGKVQSIKLVRGHPLLVNAAKDAVLQWVYHPALQDGTAIPFETDVIVPFRLAQ